MLDADLDEDEVIPVSIASWFVDEIEEDHIEFATPIFSKMCNMLADEVEAERILIPVGCVKKIRRSSR